jgi:hypothetical protein
MYVFACQTPLLITFLSTFDAVILIIGWLYTYFIYNYGGYSGRVRYIRRMKVFYTRRKRIMPETELYMQNESAFCRTTAL